MSFPDVSGLAGLGPLEREHIGRVESALGDLLLSSRLDARVRNLDASRIDGAIVSLLYALAARETFLACQERGEEFRVEACMRAAEEAALWVRDRNQRVFGVS